MVEVERQFMTSAMMDPFKVGDQYSLPSGQNLEFTSEVFDDVTLGAIILEGSGGFDPPRTVKVNIDGDVSLIVNRIGHFGGTAHLFTFAKAFSSESYLRIGPSSDILVKNENGGAVYI